MNCSCHKAKCIRCYMCSNYNCNCPAEKQRRSKRARVNTLYMEDELDDTVPVLAAATERLNQFRVLPIPPIPLSILETVHDGTTSTTIDKHSLRYLGEAFNIPRMECNSLPGAKIRNDISVNEMNANHQKRLVAFTMKIVQRVCGIVNLKDPTSLMTLCATKTLDSVENKDSNVRKNIVSVVKKLPERSLQRQALLAVLCQSYPAKTLKR